MKIGLLAPPWLPVPPPAYGGTEVVIDRLARGLLEAGHDVQLFTTGDSTCPVPKRWVLPTAADDAMGNDVLELHHVSAGYDQLRSCDLIHDHTVIGPVFSAQVPELPVVTTNHGPFDDHLLALYRAISPRVPIIAISHAQASTAADVPIAAVIHHGVEVDRFPCGSGRGGYLLYLGRMAPGKGVREAAVVARRVGARLLIAAKNRAPAEHDYFDHAVRPLLGHGVEYIGEVGGTDKLRLLAGARALLNPITWPEPFGLVMIEAMACGTPVLALRNGSAPEIVEHGVTGYLSDDLDELATSIGRVERLRRTDCRRRVERSFSAQRMVQGHIDLYRDLLERDLGSAQENPAIRIDRPTGPTEVPPSPALVDGLPA